MHLYPRGITIREGQDIDLEDLVHGLLAILALERQPPGQHLVHQHPKTPPVDDHFEVFKEKK